ISGLYHAALAPAAYASRLVLPPPLQGSLPAGWLAFTGRESNPQDRYKRFQIAVSSSFSGFILAQGKLHDVPPNVPRGYAQNAKPRQSRGQPCAQPIWPPNDTKGDSLPFVNDRGDDGLPAAIRSEIILRRHRHGERLDPDVRAPP